MPAGASQPIAAVARRLLGEPDASKSSTAKLRFGPDGLLSVDVENDSFFDYVQEIGGIGGEALEEHVRSVANDARYLWIAIAQRNAGQADLVEVAETAAPGAAPGEARTELPRELENERELLGLLLLRPDHPELHALATEECRADDFNLAIHSAIFEVLEDAEREGYEPKLATVIAAMGGESGRIVTNGYTLSAYLAHLMAQAPIVSADDERSAIADAAREVRLQAELQRTGEIDPGYDLVPDAPPVPWQSQLGTVFWSNMHRPRPHYQWLIKGIIPRHESVMIFGRRNSGKSFTAFDMAMAIARGLPYFGRKVHGGLVVYCAVEAQGGFVDVRMPAYELAHELEKGANIPFACITKRFNLFRDDTGVNLLIAELKGIVAHFSLPLEVVVIDTYNRASAGADEIKGKDVNAIIERIDKVRDEFKCGVWLVHHVNAEGTMRGHTSLGDNFETMISIEVPAEPQLDQNRRQIRSASLVKQREGPTDVAWSFVLRQIALRQDEDGEDVTSCVVEAPATGDLFTAPAIGSKPDAKNEQGFLIRSDRLKLAFAALQKALYKEGGVTPEDSGVSRNVWAVHRDHWRDAMIELGAYAGDEPAKRAENIKKALQDAMAKLQGPDFRLIGVNYPWVWRTDRKVAGFPAGPRLGTPEEPERLL